MLLKKSIKKLLVVVVTLGLVFSLAPTSQVSAKIKLSSTSKTLYVGKSTTLKIKGTKSKVKKWTTSNKKVATVNNKGKVVAKKVGKATIKAKVGKKYYSCKVTVKKKAVKKKTTVNKPAASTSTPAPTGKVVCINPGHQAKANGAKEANAPNSSVMKAKVTGGATGVFSKVAESQINLSVGMKLKTELENRGYTVIMTRTSQNVDLSNKDRSQIGNQANIAISLHCDSSASQSSKGAHTICIGKGSSLYSESYRLASNVISAYTSKTGISSRGVNARNDLTGLNWSNVPAIYIEMGFLSNPSEDGKLSNDVFQNTMASAIADGIDQYYQ